jgi:hypothetical protein
MLVKMDGLIEKDKIDGSKLENLCNEIIIATRMVGHIEWEKVKAEAKRGKK